jgi:GNAT superfamily N-acetyltransferase
MTGRRSEWIELVVAAYGDAPPGDGRHLHHAIQVCAAAGTELVGARLDGRLVGGAALGVVRDGALLYAAAVLPGYRRRGVHGALIAARLASARARGANYAFLKTADDGGARSALRAGFNHVYDRTRLVKHS